MSLITLATDNFTRANANPLSGNWTVMFSGSQGGNSWGTLQIVSNAAEPSVINVNGVEWYNGVTFPPDQWAQVTVVSAITTSNNFCGPATRISMTGTAATFYQFAAQASVGNNTWFLQKVIAGVATTLQTASLPGVTAGDVLLMIARGSSITCYRNGVLVLSANDSSITSGAAGIYSFDSTSTSATTMSPWSGGSVTYDGLGVDDSGGQALPSVESVGVVWEPLNNGNSLPAPIEGGLRGPQNSGVLYQTGGGGVTTGFGQIFPTGRS